MNQRSTSPDADAETPSLAFLFAGLLFWLCLLAWLPVAFFITAMWAWGAPLGYTLGNRVFVALGVFFVPAVAVVGFWQGASWWRFANAIALSMLAAFGLVASGTLADHLFPDYPTSGPHELFATALSLAAIFSPCLIALYPHLLRSLEQTVAATLGAGALVVGLTIYAFGAPAELRLPWRWQGIERAQCSDIQDYSTYGIRVDQVALDDAERYAQSLDLVVSETPSDCGPPPGVCDDNPRVWKPSPDGRFWFADHRRPQADTLKYPSGSAGCVEQAAWHSGVLHYCRSCDWGI